MCVVVTSFLAALPELDSATLFWAILHAERAERESNLMADGYVMGYEIFEEVMSRSLSHGEKSLEVKSPE